jgi:GAF domain-containing protein
MARSDDRQTADPDDLADVLAEVARELMGEDDLPAVLSRMSSLAVETIDGAQHCGITVVVPGRAVKTAGSSDPVPGVVDQIQYDTDEGPCLDAIREHEVFETGDISGETERWPAFAPRVLEETSIRSILSFRLFDPGGTMGALNLYADDVGAFTDDDRHVGAVFAPHAAVAMSNAQKVAHLERALETRDVIARAKGMLMARGGVSDEDAFDILRRASQRTNIKLREVARRLVEGEAITPPPDPER